MLQYKRGSREWLEFEIFQEFSDVVHGVFLRGISFDGTYVSAHQVHGATVVKAVVGAEVQECDGLVINKGGVGLLIRHADCQAAIFYDPIEKVIGNVHAGWRGQVMNIYQQTVDLMGKLYRSKAENLIVGISPSLGPCCAQFINYKTELPSAFWEYQIRPLYFDLWETARYQLIKAGVLKRHIQIAEICTCCNPADYFSYRRDKVRGQNHSTVVKLSQSTESL